MGIDPDATGAIALLQWGVDAPRLPCGGPASLADALIAVHDMPMMSVPLGKRNRRQADSVAIAALLQQVLPTLDDKAAVHAVLEESISNALNGKHSWWSGGFAFGVWSGLLAAYGMPTQLVSARRWKGQMQLNGLGKEGSRLLALQLFPQAADLLKRKKDHGRAEALLIAAWASGLGVSDAAPASAASDAAAMELPQPAGVQAVDPAVVAV